MDRALVRCLSCYSVNINSGPQKLVMIGIGVGWGVCAEGLK